MAQRLYSPQDSTTPRPYAEAQLIQLPKIRKEFPETWIWDSISDDR